MNCRAVGCRRRSLFVGALVLFASLGDLRAEESEADVSTELVDPFQIEAELTLFAGSDGPSTVMLVSPLVLARYRLRRLIDVSLAWGFSEFRTWGAEADAVSSFRMGNPFVAAHYVRDHGQFKTEVGAGVAMSLELLPDDRTRRLARDAHAYAWAARGCADIWLWAPGRMSVVIPAKVEADSIGGFVVSTEMSLAWVIPTVDEQAHDDFFIQSSIEVEHPVGRFFWGARLRNIIQPTSDHDMSQLAAAAHFRVPLSSGALMIRLDVNLDEPMGAFDVAGLTLGAAARF